VAADDGEEPSLDPADEPDGVVAPDAGELPPDDA